MTPPLTIQGERRVDSPPMRKMIYFVDHFLSYINTYIPYSPPRFNESLDIPIILTMTAPKQHKQRYYYIFWSIATLSVVIGQINVFNAYNRLSENLEILLIEQAREKILKASKESAEVFDTEESSEDIN